VQDLKGFVLKGRIALAHLTAPGHAFLWGIEMLSGGKLQPLRNET